MSGLPPPPAGMDVRITHDGVTWRIGARAGAPLLAGVSLGLGSLAAVAGALAPEPALAGAGALVLAFGLAVAVQAAKLTTVRVTDRALTIEHRTIRGTTAERVPLDELRAAAVVAADEAPEPKLVLRDRDGARVVGAGRPEGELRWMHEVIVAAREAFARRERSEGREWTFLRKAPEDLARLVERE